MFCISGLNLVILAWMSDELSCGQARDWHTHWHTDDDNTRRPKLASGKKGLKVWLLKVRHRPASATGFVSDFVCICSVYKCVIHIITYFVLTTECNSWTKQHCPTHSIVVRWGQNIVDCSYFFNYFEGCVIATQIHWKMLMVVDHMPFFRVYINA